MNQTRGSSEEQRQLEARLVEGALTLQREPGRAFVDYVRPVIRKRILLVMKAHLDRSMNRHDVDDVVQLVLEKLLKSKSSALLAWEPKRPLLPYLSTVAKNATIDWLRARDDVEQVESSVLEQMGDSSSVVEDRDELFKLVDTIDDELSPKDSQIFHYCILDKMPNDEFAELTGMSTGNVSVSKHRVGKKVSAIAQRFRGNQ